MNGIDSTYESNIDISNDKRGKVNNLYFNSFSSSIKNVVSIPKLTSENRTIDNERYQHRHTSKCFITSVFMHGVSFILNKRKYNEEPKFPKEEAMKTIYSIYDGLIDDGISLDRWSTSSDRSHIIESTRSSEGFSEMDITETGNINLNKTLDHLSIKLRLSLCENCISLPKLSDSFYQSLENVLIFFQDKYNQCQWLDSCVAEIYDLSSSLIHKELYKIYEGIFSERINWGRIVVMIGFVAELSLCALNNSRIDLIETYLDTSVCYVDEHIIHWIVERGGWEAMVDFDSDQRGDNRDLDTLFGSFGRVATVLALALAGIFICRFVADRI